MLTSIDRMDGMKGGKIDVKVVLEVCDEGRLYRVCFFSAGLHK